MAEQDFGDVQPTAAQIQELEQLPAKSGTWTDRTTQQSLLPADRARILADDQALQARIDRESAGLAHNQEALYQRWNAEEAPLNDRIAQLEGEEADFASRPPGTTADKVIWQPPKIDTKQLSGFTSALVAMSLIGGLASRGNWQGAIAPMTGALQGLVDGNKEATERAWREYQAAYQNALNHDKEVQKQFEDILRAKNLSINQMIRQVQNVATRYGREDMRLAAQQRSIDAMIARHQAMDISLANIERSNDTTGRSFTAALATPTKSAKQAALGGELTEKGLWLSSNLLVNGSPILTNLVHSKYSSPAMYDVVNDIADYFADHPELDPSNISANKASLAVGQSVLRNVQNRRVAVQRLTDSIQGAEDVVLRLTAKINSHGMDPQNATFNWLSRNLGHDPDVIKLRQLMWTLGTQYTEATTMPGSNAQLHATVQQDMVSHFNPNFNLGHMMGLFSAVNTDIGLVKKALDSSEAEVQQSMAHSRVQIPMMYFIKPSNKTVVDQVVSQIPQNGYGEHAPDEYWSNVEGFGPQHAPPAAAPSVVPAQSAAPTPAASKVQASSPEEAAALKYRD